MERRRRLLALLSGLTAVWAGLSAGWPGERLRNWERNLDAQLLQLRGQKPPPAAVMLVAVDDASLQQGAWFAQAQPGAPPIPSWARGINTLPWPRSAYGRISETLLKAGAAAVAINVVFEGPSGRGPDDDAAFTAVLARHPGRIVLASEWLEPEDSRGAGALTLVKPQHLIERVGAPVAVGLTNLLPPQPGEPLRHPDAYRRALADAGISTPPTLSSVLLQRMGHQSKQRDAERNLNVYGPEGHFRRIPAWEVLDPQRWAAHPLRPAVQDAVVLVGPVVSQGDSGLPTPFGALSGLELLATAAANSLKGDGLAAWPSSALPRALFAGALVLFIAWLALRRLALQGRLVLVGVSFVALLVAAGLLLVRAQLLLPLLAPGGGLLMLGLLYGSDGYLQEQGERRRLRRTFERYVAPNVVAEILEDPEAAQGMLRGRSLPVTVLFSDLKGFTELTRRRSAKGESELHVRQLNAYLGAMVEVINRHGGTVDKFIGDAVMAVFGSPVGRGETLEAQAALGCAQDMLAALQQLNVVWQDQGLEPLASGVGLASGEVMVGQIGSPERMEFTVIGDTVNRASRVEGLTRALPAPLLLDAATAALVGDAKSLISMGAHELKGLEVVELFTPAG
jgi:adenylate cyclase